MRSEAITLDPVGGTVLPIAELAAFARRTTAEAFSEKFGPIALLVKPSEPELRRAAMLRQATMHNGQGPEYLDDLLIMLRAFRTLTVSFLSPRRSQQGFSVGRDDQSDLLLNDPSVSKRHASLVWTGKTWMVRDEHSLNGTFVNADQVPGEGLEVSNGDTVGFGDALAVFIQTRTLHSQLLALP